MTQIQQLKLYGSPLSGHCHRVELLLRMLGIPYEFIALSPEQRASEAFLKLNPLRQIPVLEDGDVVVADSVAIMVYLIRKYAPDTSWFPDDPVTASQIQRWLSIAAGELASGPNSARLMAVFGRPGHPDTIGQTSKRLLDFMDAHLKGRMYLVGDGPTIADLACYAYVAHAPEGGIDLAPYPSVRAWLKSVEALPQFKPMPASKPKVAA
jgi:glutathione S-transferase